MMFVILRTKENNRLNIIEVNGTVLDSECGAYEFKDSKEKFINLKITSGTSEEFNHPFFLRRIFFFIFEIIAFFSLSKTDRHEFFNFCDCNFVEIDLELEQVGQNSECEISIDETKESQTVVNIKLKELKMLSSKALNVADNDLYNRCKKHNASLMRLILISGLPVFVLLIFSVVQKFFLLSFIAFLATFLTSTMYFVRKNLLKSFVNRFNQEKEPPLLSVVD